MKMPAVLLVATSLVLLASGVSAYKVNTFDLFMRDAWPHKDELYLCTPLRVSPYANFFIVGFEPHASMRTVHHMLLYGCTKPGSNDTFWDCGEMQNDDGDSMYTNANPCSAGSQVVYAWARDAPSLHLPSDVGFHVGKNSPMQFLVLQVHYMSRFPEGKTDKSGIYIQYTEECMKRQAGVILLGTGGYIMPNKVEHMETACTIHEKKVIHPFAFRTHTHSLGTVVSGYVIRRSERGDNWSLLGKKNPQLPQMFYPVTNTRPIEKGDVLAARCTMNNTHNYPVKIGPTNNDEMCNFYLMYWVENTNPLARKYCFTNGPPYYYWSKAPEKFTLIPDLEASTL